VVLFQVRRNCLTLQFRAELRFDHKTVADWSQFCCKAMLKFILICSLQLFFNGGWRGVGKFVEIYDRCFSRQKCNCGWLHATAWLFVGVKRELGTPVLHLSLISPLRHCSSSLRHVSHPAPQLSVTAWRVDAHKYDRTNMDARHV